MNKSVIFSLFLMGLLLMGTSLNMNMFSTAMASSDKDRDDDKKRYHHDDKKRYHDGDKDENKYRESSYEPDPYSSSYNMGYGYDSNSYGYDTYGQQQQQQQQQQQPSYDQPRYDYSSQGSYGDYSEYKTKDKKYECRTGPFEGFFTSSVEFCFDKKFDDKKRDHKDNRDDNKTGPQGPQGPIGPIGPQGPPGINGTNGVNGTDFDPCVACLLDALVKLDSGAILVNVTANIELSGPEEVNITLPLVIDVDVALLVQQALANSSGLNENATIFEICAAINATGLDTEDVLTILDDKLGPIVEQQISQIVLTIAQAINDLLGIPLIDLTAAEIIDAVDIDAIVAQITANVEVSLGILETCLGLPPTTPIDGAGGSSLIASQIPTIQQMNPTILQNSLTSGESMLQVH
jgi:hypothetical protein